MRSLSKSVWGGRGVEKRTEEKGREKRREGREEERAHNKTLEMMIKCSRIMSYRR